MGRNGYDPEACGREEELEVKRLFTCHAPVGESAAAGHPLPQGGEGYDSRLTFQVIFHLQEPRAGANKNAPSA